MHDIKKSKYDYVAEAVYLAPSRGRALSEAEMEYMVRETKGGRNHFDFEYYHDASKEKSACVTANIHKGVPYNVLVESIPVNTTADGKAQCLRATCYKDGIRNMVGNNVDRKTCVAEPIRIGTIENEAKNADFDSQQYRIYSPDGKSVTICGQGGGVGAKTGWDGVQTCLCAGQDGGVTLVQTEDGYEVVASDGKTYPVYEVKDGFIIIKGEKFPIKLADGYYIIRKLTVTECKRLQTVPEEYDMSVISPTQAYKCLGNGWTVDVIAHLMSHFDGLTDEPVEVLSMYDGMSCGRIALGKLGANVERYYATEIDKYAIKVTQHNYTDTIQLGDAFQVREDDWALPNAKEIVSEGT